MHANKVTEWKKRKSKVVDHAHPRSDGDLSLLMYLSGCMAHVLNVSAVSGTCIGRKTNKPVLQVFFFFFFFCLL